MPITYSNKILWETNWPARDLTDAEIEQLVLHYGADSFNRLVGIGLYSVAAPTNLIANPGNAYVNLSWAGQGSGGNYSVYRSTTLGGTYTVIASNVNSNYYTDSTVSNGSYYYYKVASAVGTILSAFSNTVSALPTGFGGTSGSAVFATPGLARWYSAQAAGVAYGSKVASLPDLSNSNVNASQAVAALQPTLTSTGPGNTSILNANVLDTASLEYPYLATPGYVFSGFSFVIAFVTSSKAANRLCVQGVLCATSTQSSQGSGNALDGFEVQYSRNLGFLRFLYNGLTLTISSVAENTPVVLSCKTVNNGNNTYDAIMRVNGQQVAIFTQNAGQSTGTFSKLYVNQNRYNDQPGTAPSTDVNGDGGNGTDEGKYSELAFYNATLSDAQLSTIEHEIASRNGYSIS